MCKGIMLELLKSLQLFCAIEDSIFQIEKQNFREVESFV